MKIGKGKRRGSILVMSIFFMLILFITASAFLVLLPVESRAARHSETLAQASLTSDAGVNEAMIWLREQLAPKDQSPSREPMASGVYPSENARTRNLGNGWTYRWELVADSQTYPNGSNQIRAYTIISKAFRNGRIVREARAEVIQDSLSGYAELIDEWPTNLVMPLRSDSAPKGGPVHINDILRLWIPEGSSFWSSAGEPIFDHGLTAVDTGSANDSSQDGFLYYQGNWWGSDSNKRPYNSGGPIESRYARMAVGGRDSMNSGAQYIPLPENTFDIKDAAWGFQQGNFPNQPGVYINEVDNQVQGIYIEGDVEEMQLGFGGSEPAGTGTASYGENSWVKVELPISGQDSIDDNENYTVISIGVDPIVLPAGTTLNGNVLASPQTLPVGDTLLRKPDGTFSHYESALNGVVYSTGDIRDLWGTNKGRRTIAVEGDVNDPPEQRKSIEIGGRENDSLSGSNTPVSLAAGEKGLLQYGAVDADGDGVLDPPTNADNVLGLIARDVMISDRLKDNDRWDSAHPEDNPLYLYAITLAGLTGDGGTFAVEDYDDGGGGWVYRYGSRIMVDGGAWGTTSGNGLVNGNTFFDEPAAASPPPYFPSQPTFTLKSYYEQHVTTGETL